MIWVRLVWVSWWWTIKTAPVGAVVYPLVSGK
jgi:hypothetical protein